ncbi:MAG: ChaN family lipoprotein [Thermodesulfobacteriota bacterium]
MELKELLLTVVCVLIVATCHAMRASADALIIDLYMGEPISMEELVDDLSRSRVVYLGEIHSITRHHEVQRQILERLSDKGLKLALAMEQFTREQQAALDRWSAGKGDLRDLIRDLGGEYWTNIWDYESVLTTARSAKIRILGLNAPDRLVKKVARSGIEGLSESERAEIPSDTTTINPDLDRLLRLRLRVHKAFEKRRLDAIVLAQALRDATMAQTVARFLDSDEGKDATVVVIAGSGHVNYGLGIPERVSRVHHLPFRIVIPTESGELRLSEQEKRQSVPVHITHEDMRFLKAPIADYLHVIPRKPDGEKDEIEVPKDEQQPTEDNTATYLKFRSERQDSRGRPF